MRKKVVMLIPIAVLACILLGNCTQTTPPMKWTPWNGTPCASKTAKSADTPGHTRHVHAIVNSVSFGDVPDAVHDVLHWSEVPITDEIRFQGAAATDTDDAKDAAQPADKRFGKKRFFVLVQGILVSSKTENEYADVLYQWKGLKCSSAFLESGTFWGEGPKIRRGPIPETRLHKTNGFKFHLNLVNGNTKTLEPIDFPHKIYRNVESKEDSQPGKDSTPTTKDWVTVNLLEYSFRQNRALFLIDSDVEIEEVRIDVGNLNKNFRGFLRIHLLDCNYETEVSELWTPPSCNLGDDECIRFEEYGRAPNYLNIRLRGYKIGRPLDTLFAMPTSSDIAGFWNSNSPKGDFLLPVGLNMSDGQLTTSRSIMGLPSDKWLLAKVQGMFIFSGYSPGVPAKNGQYKDGDAGGGGGTEDFQFRMDHIRALRPVIYPTHAGLFGDYSVHLFPKECGMKVLRGKGCAFDKKCGEYKCEGKWVDKLTDPLDDLRLDHTYWIKFRAPEGESEESDSRISFYVYDQGLFQNPWKKTFDNCGALTVTIQAVLE